MRLILDTHVYLWARHAAGRLTDQQRAAITDPGNTVLVSAVSIAEIAIKSALGKLTGAERVLEDPTAGGQFDELALTSAHAGVLRHLPFHHRDPFDRLLVAQAMSESATLVTHDQALASYAIDLL